VPKSQGTAPIPWQQSVPAQRPWQAIGQIGCRDHECSREQLGSRTLPRAPLPFASPAVEFPSSISTRRGPRQVGRAKRSSTWGRTRSASARCSVSSVPSGHIEIPLPARGHEHSPHWERLRMAVAWSRSLLHPADYVRVKSGRPLAAQRTRSANYGWSRTGFRCLSCAP